LIVAHPDADDAFRFYGLLSGKICAKASWLTQDFNVGKLALFFGANDFGGTILEENVVAAAGKEHKPARVEEIIKAVESVGRPVAQRNTRYEVL
jgi:cyclic dehypoxanthinyl futalosine synthase